jgi:hypothetical protein
MKIEELAARIAEKKPGLSDKEINAFEAELGFSFPDDYMQFLHLAKGGGELKLGSVEYLEFKKSKMSYHPEIFCLPGIGEYHHIRSLDRHFEDLEYQVTDVPCGIFTIADDMFGNFLTIDLRSNSFGQIAVVDHETIGENFNDPETYKILTSSFSEFVKFCNLAKETYIFETEGEDKIEILDASEIHLLITRAQASGKVARMYDESGQWIAFRPKNNGGHVFNTMGGSPAIWQTYYPDPASMSPSPDKVEIFDRDLTIIDPEHAVKLFQYKMGILHDLEVRAKEVK